MYIDVYPKPWFCSMRNVSLAPKIIYCEGRMSISHSILLGAP